MTPYPADFGGYVIGALPYAGLEALRIAAWCAAAVALAAAGVWLLGRAGRLARPPLSRRERDLPALSRAIGNVERRTRAMSAAELDAVHGPKLGDLTGPDYMVTGQLTALQDALTRADLDSARQSCHRCRTGSTAFPCTCVTDCFEAECQGRAARS